MPSLLLYPDEPIFTIATVNTAYVSATGKKATNLIGKSIFEILPGYRVDHPTDEVKKLKLSLHTVLKTKKPDKVASCPGSSSMQENIPIAGEDGEITCIIHIPPHKESKVNNRAINDCEVLINSTDDLIWSVRNDFKLIAANKAFIKSLEALSNYTINAGDNLLMPGAFPEDFLLFWKELYTRGLSGESFKKEIHLPAFNDNKDAWSETGFTPIYDAGIIIGLACYARNITERKLTEEDNIFKAELLNTIGQAVVATNLDGMINYWNKAAEEIYGWTVSEAIGKNVVDLLPALQTKEQAREIMQELLQGHAWSGEHMVRGKDGCNFPAYVTDAPVYDRNKKLSGVIGISANITAQKEAEAKIKTSENQYRTLFEQTLAGFYQSTVTGTLLKCNDAFVKMLKYDSQKELLGINTNELYFSNTERKDFISNVIEHKKLTNHEGVLKCKDGTPLYFLENMLLGQNEFTGEYFFDGIILDITTKKKAEDKLVSTSNELQLALTEQIATRKKISESEKRFRQIVETAQEGIWLIDENDYTTFVNKKMCEIIQYSSEELIGQKIYHFMNDESTKNALMQIERRKKGISEIHDSVFITKSGKDVWVNISTNPVMNESGEYNGALAMITDITERKRSELLLEQSNERFVNITKATFDAIWDWDIFTNEIFWGEGFINLFGKMDNVENTNIEMLRKRIHPDDIDELLGSAATALKGKVLNWSYEHRYLKADGSYAYVSNKALIIRNKKGKATRVVGAMQDITSKKALEELLNKANVLARIGSWEIDVVKKTLYWSYITKEIHETGADFIPDLETAINFYKEGRSRDLITRHVQDAIEEGSPFDVELQIITARGNEKWVRAIGESKMVNGKCIAIYGSFQDINVLKNAELAATEILKEKNTILESIDDAFFAVDSSWIVTYWNKQAEKLMGKPKTEILGLNLWHVYPGLINSELYRIYHEVISTKQAAHFENYFDPLASWYEVSVYSSGDGLSVYFKNISDRKNSVIRLNKLHEDLQAKAKELATSNAELEQFAYVASHDLQEPLRMVASFLTQLEKKYGDVIDDTGKKYIGFAVDGAKRMRQIIFDLLEFSRVGRIEEKLEAVNLTNITEEIQILFRKQITEKNAHIVVGKMPVINSYKAPLRQVFQNLISNALKYSRTDAVPEIRVSARKLINHWQFAVADNGIGIDEKNFERIFIIFQRLHNRDEFPGTGVGLAVTKKIIDNMGGKIWLESKEGKGSTFYFTLPKHLQ